LLIACLAKSAFAFGDRRDLVRRLFVAAVLSPLVIFLSFPGVFVLAGLYAAWWWDSRAKRCARTGLGFVVFAAAIGISFLVLWAGPIHAQKDERIVACWANAFPDWSRPWNLPWWLAVATTDVARYSFVPVGNALFGAIVVGGLSLWSADRRSLLVLLLLPVALAAAAGALGHYPFGCYRVMVFAAPACWLMAGAGVAALFQRPDRFSRLAAIALAGLAAFGVAQACYRVIVPWKRAEVGSAVAYVRARIQPTDAVIGNAWEDAYYFRDGAITYVPSETFESLPFDRVWVIATTPNPRLRDAILKKVEAHGRWRVVDRQEFTRVGVYALEREN
jgi:disulfide bond formation protein DsbB